MATRVFRPPRATAGTLAFVFVTLALAPYVLTGYGEPLFKGENSSDPGNLSQRLVPGTPPFMPATSYTRVVEALAAVPIIGVTPMASAVGLRLSRGSVWGLTAAFWAQFACLLSLGCGRLARRRGAAADAPAVTDRF